MAVRRLQEIDFLRGIAVILVLFRHHHFFDPLYKAGWMGVDLFFVLSGFLVSGLLFKQYLNDQKVHVGNFLIRRGFKIYPLFYLMIGATILFKLMFGKTIDRYDLISELLFVQNYLGSMWNHTWSLAIEEHFYIGLSLFIFIMVRYKLLENIKLFVSVCLFFFVGCLALRIYNHMSYDYKDLTHSFPTHLRIDSLLFGVFLSYFYHFRKAISETFFRKNKMVLGIVALLFLVPPFFYGLGEFFMNTFGLSLLYVGFGIILMLFLVNNNTVEKLNKILNKHFVRQISNIGYYSYSIYLFHMFVAVIFIRDLEKFGLNLDNRISFVLYFIISVFAGIIISKLTEQPVLKFRDKYFTIRKKTTKK